MAIQDKKDLAEKISLAPATIAKWAEVNLSVWRFYIESAKKLNVDFADMVSIVNGEESE